MFAERERVGLTLEELGEKAGIKNHPRQHTWRYEAGIVRRPRPFAMLNIARVLGVDYRDLTVRNADLVEREAVLCEWLRGDQKVPFYDVMDERFGSIR